MGRGFYKMLTGVGEVIKDLEDMVISENQPSLLTRPLALPASV